MFIPYIIQLDNFRKHSLTRQFSFLSDIFTPRHFLLSLHLGQLSITAYQLLVVC